MQPIATAEQAFGRSCKIQVTVLGEVEHLNACNGVVDGFPGRTAVSADPNSPLGSGQDGSISTILEAV
jgi:hypothetical protein